MRSNHFFESVIMTAYPQSVFKMFFLTLCRSQKALSCFLLAFIMNSACPSLSLGNEPQIRLGLVPFIGEATNYYALDANIFDEQGIRVSIQENRAGFESLRNLIEGELDIATVATTAFMYGAYGRYGKGKEFSVIASILESTEMNFIIASSKSGIVSPKDLDGKRVALTGRTASEYVWDIFSQFHNLDVDSIEILDMPVPEMLDAMKDQRIDVAVAWPPYHLSFKTDIPGGVKIFTAGELYTTNWLVVVSDEFKKNHPDAVARYLNSLVAAEAVMDIEPKRVANENSKHFGLSAATIEGLYDLVSFNLSLDEKLITNLDQQAVWALNRGYIAKREPINFRDLIDSGHLKIDRVRLFD